jgi:cytochrome o ubiquinol oxidase subunit 3
MDNSLEVRYVHDTHADTSTPDPHQDAFSRVTLGFWTYLMTDCLLFASLFATYAVLKGNTFGGPSSKDLFSLKTAFIETMVLLLSSATCGFAILSSIKDKKNHAVAWLAITCLLGLTFLTLELTEFHSLVQEGNSWTRSAFLSSFFGLVGTHGLHVFFGLIWAFVMIGQLSSVGITLDTFRRLVLFGMFWHFLDLVWIFIFTFVYLFGVI